jgi:hypothetical protein
MTNPVRVLFVGPDVCARTPVLSAAGYQILTCECEPAAIVGALVETPVDAVLFHCEPTAPSHLITAAARATTDAPLVLFARGSASYEEADYDLILPTLCSPQEWLPPLTETISFRRDPKRRKPSKTATIDSPRKNGKYKART